MWIALYINCFAGHFLPYGPFESHEDAIEWINTEGLKERSDRSSWEAIKLRRVR